ncbi:hypothetical protein BAE44_0023061 [Dichanthelium oligosanthes]|uniref:RING-type E3 ubiquitin transferase n=1 Tax=Dichanthelium oligosanthes TaxID=888268 RepID=A0A1E5USN8_9POAL|nr:hypothetical protein BAE44_0023061 [Dichanthelium oligosanthes]
MDEAMGRRTVSGLLVTKGGSILVFREESPRHKATSCCTRLGCSSKLFPNKDRKMHRTSKETSAPQRSQILRKSNRMSPQGSISYDRSTSKNEASTFGETDSRPRRRENAGRDLLARLKERVNASRKRSLSGGSSPSLSPPNKSSSGSLSSSQSISRSICQPSTRMRKDGGRVEEAVRMHKARDNRGSTREDVLTRNSNQDPSSRFLSRSLFRHRSGLHQGPISSLEDSLDDSDEYWHFDMDGSEEELLALGERIGTVSTGLSDGALSECLKRSLYVPTTTTSHEDGDLKCIICQVCSYIVIV